MENRSNNFPILVKFKTQIINSGSCKALAFNEYSNILVCGIGPQIIIFNPENGNLKIQNTLKYHKSQIFCIEYSKKSNWFVSAGMDQQIICWQQNKNKWNINQQLQRHNNWIIQLLLNQQEDELISCSYDKSIQIWKVNKLQNTLFHLYQLENGHSNMVSAICLNFLDNILVSTSYDQQMIIWQKNDENKWINRNSCLLESFVFRMCFVNNKQLIFFQQREEFLCSLFIEIDQSLNIIKLPTKLNLSQNDEWLFPMMYNKERNLIFCKHNKYVYIIKQLSDANFKLINKFESQSHQNYGVISQNFRYQVSWDQLTKEINFLEINGF